MYKWFFPLTISITESYNALVNHVDSEIIFLFADTQLYKRLCPSVGPLVCWFVDTSQNNGKTDDLGSGPEGDDVL